MYQPGADLMSDSRNGPGARLNAPEPLPDTRFYGEVESEHGDNQKRRSLHGEEATQPLLTPIEEDSMSVPNKTHGHERVTPPISVMLDDVTDPYTAQSIRDGRRSYSDLGSFKDDPATLFHGLRIQTNFNDHIRSDSTTSQDSEPRLLSSASAHSLSKRVLGLHTQLQPGPRSRSPGSVVSSPQISAMVDITPLPSPTVGTSDAWKAIARTRSRGSSTSSRSDLPPPAYLPTTFSPDSPRRKGYQSLGTRNNRHSTSEDQQALVPSTGDKSRTRSVSDYVPEHLSVPRQRNIAVSGNVPFTSAESTTPTTPMHREEYLGVQRGLVSPVKPPTPPATISGSSTPQDDGEPAAKRQKTEVFVASSVKTGHEKQYESIRELGQGTFSKVYLAVRQVQERKDSVDYRIVSTNMAGVRARSRRLVAVKVVEHGPAGGADAERIAISLKREVEILKSVQHPSLVHLKAFGTDSRQRTLLVMNYCPGGDLFEIASQQPQVLVPPLVRRIFAELVSAVRYLHQHFIVHRDIKLENVLLNIPIQVHSDVSNWQTLDRAVVTIIDMGLSRRIPDPPESPMLTTRCGSEDYAAPEILMGQPYDGRQTDAWALGVLLYALMEGRLPFDPLPGARGDPAVLRARTPHRIARCEWAWVKYGDEDGDWDPDKANGMAGAFTCVDALLKRNTRRKALNDIQEISWVKEGIQISGGLKMVEDEVVH